MNILTPAGTPSVGGTEPPVFDFRQAGLLSRSQCRQLLQHFSRLGRHASGSLTDYLKVPVTIELEDVDSVTYGEVFQSAEEPRVHFVFAPAPNQPPGVMQSSIGLMYAIIELMMGATGVTPIPDKRFTEFDRAMMTHLAARILKLIAECAPSTLTLDATMIRTEVNERLIPRTLEPKTLMVRLRLKMSMEGCSGRIACCLPLEVMRATLRSNALGPQGTSIEAAVERLDEISAGMAVTLTVELGRVHLSANQLMEIQPGDVFVVSGEPLACIGTAPKYRVRPGLVGDRLAAEITHTLRDQDVEGGDRSWL